MSFSELRIGPFAHRNGTGSGPVVA
jgi:hypothetical protein